MFGQLQEMVIQQEQAVIDGEQKAEETVGNLRGCSTYRKKHQEHREQAKTKIVVSYYYQYIICHVYT
jgi:hypothetical protein